MTRQQQVTNLCETAIDALMIIHEDVGEQAVVDLFTSQVTAFLAYVTRQTQDINLAATATLKITLELCNSLAPKRPQ